MITHLGNIRLDTNRMLNGLTLRFSPNFATHERVLNKPIRQHVGNNLDEYNLEFKLSHHFCDPQTELLKLKAVCDQAKPVPLIFGYFDYNGWVTLDNVDVSFVDTSDNGRPLTVAGTLTLTEVVDVPPLKPPTPAVRLPDVAKPVQTVTVAEPTQLIPNKQPLQHLEDALIAEHKAQAFMRKVGITGDISLAPLAAATLQQVQAYYTNNPTAPLAVLAKAITDLHQATTTDQVNVVIENLAPTQAFFASEVARLAARLL